MNTGILVAGMIAVAIPIIIHLLFRKRKKPMEWGAMRFVMEAYRKTRKRMLIERWLLLACRCLLVAAIAVALGRPLLQRAGVMGAAQGGRTVYVIIDDGLASQASEDGRTALQRSVEAARTLVGSFGAGDRVGVILAGGGSGGRPLVMPPSGDIAGVRAALDGVMATDAPSDVPGALAMVGETIRQSRASGTKQAGAEDVVIVASAFRSGSVKLTDSLAKLPAGVRLIGTTPPATSPANVSIRSVRALRPVLIGGQSSLTQTVTVTLQRWGAAAEQAGVTTVRVRPEGVAETSASPATVRWAAGQREAAATVALEGSPTAATNASGTTVILATIDGDAIAGDNTWRLPLLSREALRVGIVADALARGSTIAASSADRFKPGQWAMIALRPSEAAAVDTVDLDPAALDTPRLAGLDAVLVVSPEAVAPEAWQRLRSFVDAGGLLLLTPAFEATTHTWTDAMNQGLGLAGGWTLARTTKDYPSDQPGKLATVNANNGGGESDLLSALRGEIDDLARPVALLKVLAPDLEAGAGTSGDARDEFRPLLLSADGAPILTLITRRAAGNVETGSRGAIVYVSVAFDLRWSDLPAKPLMLPLMQELVRQGVGRARPALMATAGGRLLAPPQTADLRTRTTPAKVLAVDGTGQSAEPVLSGGVWQASDARGAVRGLIAVNAPADAGDTAAISATGIQNWLQGAVDVQGGGTLAMLDEVQLRPGNAALTGALSNQPAAGATGPMLLALAAGLALIEVALARSASRASIIAPASKEAAHA